MNLGDIYQGISKAPIHSNGATGGIPTTRERDPKSVELENNVFSKMQHAVTPLTEIKNEQKPEPVQEIQPVGLEQAMKELLNGVQSLDDKL
jgi:hypothetical protein